VGVLKKNIPNKLAAYEGVGQAEPGFRVFSIAIPVVSFTHSNRLPLRPMYQYEIIEWFARHAAEYFSSRRIRFMAINVLPRYCGLSHTGCAPTKPRRHS
jgi:hypothetical protein